MLEICANTRRKIVVHYYLHDQNEDLFCWQLHDERKLSWQGACPPPWVSFALMEGTFLQTLVTLAWLIKELFLWNSILFSLVL